MYPTQFELQLSHSHSNNSKNEPWTRPGGCNSLSARARRAPPRSVLQVFSGVWASIQYMPPQTCHNFLWIIQIHVTQSPHRLGPSLQVAQVYTIRNLISYNLPHRTQIPNSSSSQNTLQSIRPSLQLLSWSNIQLHLAMSAAQGAGGALMLFSSFPTISWSLSQMANNSKEEPKTGPEPDRWYNLTLGSSFKEDSSNKYCTLRCKLKLFFFVLWEKKNGKKGSIMVCLVLKSAFRNN